MACLDHSTQCHTSVSQKSCWGRDLTDAWSHLELSPRKPEGGVTGCGGGRACAWLQMGLPCLLASLGGSASVLGNLGNLRDSQGSGQAHESTPSPSDRNSTKGTEVETPLGSVPSVGSGKGLKE